MGRSLRYVGLSSLALLALGVPAARAAQAAGPAPVALGAEAPEVTRGLRAAGWVLGLPTAEGDITATGTLGGQPAVLVAYLYKGRLAKVGILVRPPVDSAVAVLERLQAETAAWAGYVLDDRVPAGNSIGERVATFRRGGAEWGRCWKRGTGHAAVLTGVTLEPDGSVTLEHEGDAWQEALHARRVREGLRQVARL